MTTELKETHISVLLCWPANEDEGEVKFAHDVREGETVVGLLTRLLDKAYSNQMSYATIELRVKRDRGEEKNEKA